MGILPKLNKPINYMKTKLAVLLSLVLICSAGSLQAKNAKGLKLDTDGDGKVSLAEFVAGKKDKAKAEKAFTKLDKNSDGFLSKEELEGAKKKKK